MKPLEGLKVLDFTQFTSGPVCTYILADLGADVYKLENPPYGDMNHYNSPSKNKHSVYITSLNHGKKSVLLNMKNAEHKELFLKMAESADLVIDNFKAGTLEKFGITYDILKEKNPKIVWTSISGFGQTGPWSKRTAFDITIQAASGLVSVSGEENGAPVKAGISMSDFCSGLQSCCGTLAALLDAKRTGKGRRLDLAMLDSSFSLVEQEVATYLATGEIAKPMGRQSRNFVPYNSFVCKDGKEMLICTRTNQQFKKLCEVLECEEKTQETKYSTVSARLAHRQEVNDFIAEAVGRFDFNELAVKMEQCDLPYGNINTIDAVVAMEQVKERNMMVTGKYKDGTECMLVGIPIKLSGLEDEKERTCCFKGEDTIEVLSQYADESYIHALFDAVLKESDAMWAERAAKLK